MPRTPTRRAARAANGSSGEKTTYRRVKHESYNIYIYKVLKQVHPEIGVSKKAMDILNSFVHDIFNRVTIEAGNLCKYSHKQTLGAREMQSAVRLVLPGELARHATTEGTKAVNKYQSTIK